MKINYNFKISVPVVLDNFNNEQTSICIGATFFELIIRQSDQSSTHIKNLSESNPAANYYENTNLTCNAAKLLENIIRSAHIICAPAVFSIEIKKRKNCSFIYECPESYFCAGFIAINSAYNNYFDRVALTHLILKHISDYIPSPNLSLVSCLLNGGICFSSGKKMYRYPYLGGLSVLVFNATQARPRLSFISTPVVSCELLHCFYNKHFEGMRNNMQARCANVEYNNYKLCDIHNAIQFNLSRGAFFSALFKNNIDAETCLVELKKSNSFNQSLHSLNYEGITKS